MTSGLETKFTALARTLPATVGVAIVAAGTKPVTLGTWTSGVAWSTSKVPLAIASARSGSGAPQDVVAAIVASDNAAAEALWSRLGDAAGHLVQAVIREAGDDTTIVESRRLRGEYSPFGQTPWSLTGQARFAAGLTNVSGAAPVIALLHELSAEHRWGLAAKGFAAKGGWGPGLTGDYLVRQFAVVSETVGVAIAADVPGGGYENGVEVLDAIADWLVAEALAEY